MKKTIYIVPATLLYQAARFLQPPEQMCFVTGIKFTFFGSDVVVLTQLVKVDGAASRVHVMPNPASLFRAHQQLLAMGMDIEGQFHSHPGTGRQAIYPSPIDVNTARRWEIGAPFIGAVFSEGAEAWYVRFFNHSQASEVIVYGNCLETEQPGVYELPAISADSLPTQENQCSRLVADRPTGEDCLVEPGNDMPSQGPFGWRWWPRK